MKLKPCPFCGVVPELENLPDKIYDIECREMSCGVEVSLKKYASSKIEAVKFWNKRSK